MSAAHNPDEAWATLQERSASGVLASGRDTDVLIGRAMGWEVERQGNGRLVYRRRSPGRWQTLPCWSSSMDDAVRLHGKEPPPLVPSAPIPCAVEAVRRHRAQQEALHG